MNYPKGALSWILVITHPLLATCLQLVLLLTHPPGIISPVSSTCSMTPLKHYKASLLQYFIGTLITLCYSIPSCVIYFSLTVGTCCSHCTYCFSCLVKVMSLCSFPNTFAWSLLPPPGKPLHDYSRRQSPLWSLLPNTSLIIPTPPQTFIFCILSLMF